MDLETFRTRLAAAKAAAATKGASTMPSKLASAVYDRPVTVYLRGEFLGNVHRIECRSLKVTIRPYAQYESAIHLEWIGKGQRRARGTVLSYSPWGLVLDGHGHPAPDSPWEHVL